MIDGYQHIALYFLAAGFFVMAALIDARFGWLGWAFCAGGTAMVFL